MDKCGLHLTKIMNFNVKIENQDIIKNVSFDIHCKELTMIIGKNGAGYVPQYVNIERNMPTTVYDMFASYISNKPVWAYKDKKLYEEIRQALKVFGAEDLIDKRAGNLSGGELQRVLLSIATTPIPNLLILDEPISGVDRNGTKNFYEILNKLKEQNDISILLVSHDLDLVKKYADKVILLDKEVKKQGKVDEVFNSEEYKNIFGQD